MSNREPKVHVIDGVTYVEVDRKAEVGDLILQKNGGYVRYCINSNRWKEKHDGDGISVDRTFYETDVWYNGYGLLHEEYRVLEPLESEVYGEAVTVDQSQASEQVIEMFTALSRKIVSLERQLADTQRNVETWAEQTESTKYLAESNEQDIAMLDERTQVINAITKFYGGERR